MKAVQYFKKLKVIMDLVVNGNCPKDSEKLVEEAKDVTLRYIPTPTGWRFILTSNTQVKLGNPDFVYEKLEELNHSEENRFIPSELMPT